MSTDALVPTLDLGTLTADELLGALGAHSCVMLTGPGIAATERAEVVRLAREFFSAPESVRRAVQWPGDGPWRGWQPMVSVADIPDGATRRAKLPDLVERFEIRLPIADPASDDADWAGAFSLWPTEPAGFALAWTRYYRAMAALCDRMVSLIAEALDLPADEVPAWTRHQFSNLAVNHFPAQDLEPEPGRMRAKPHTDIGGLTLLWAEDVPGGLQVRLPGSSEWADVRFPPDALLLQAGDLLTVWTGGRVPANLHRVVNPDPTEGPGTDRCSIVFFHHPALDTVVRSAVPADRAAAGVAVDDIAVTAGGYVLRRQGQEVVAATVASGG